MTKPRLSICIATYNRAGYIGETLESIIPQLTEEVELVVVDGASTDNTENIVRRYAEECKQINYIRLPAKGGVDQDYCVAVEQAQGEMCWLFPDDDLLNPGAVRTVLEEAKKGYSLIVVNARVMNLDFSKIMVNKRLEIDSNEIYDESQSDQLFERVIPFMSFIGCVVINRNLWLQREKKRYFGTEFIHVGVIFQAPLPGKVLVIAEPYITIRFGTHQWSSRSLEIWLLKWPNLLYSFEHISEPARQKYQLITSRRKWNSIFYHRAKGAYSLKEYMKLFSSKDSPFSLRIGAFLIAIFPGYIANHIMLFLCKKAGQKFLLEISELENSKYYAGKLMFFNVLKNLKEKLCI